MDDRDVYAMLLASMVPASTPQLLDSRKTLRTLAIEALKTCPTETVEPHLGPVRASKKKAQRDALAALGL